MTHRNDRGLRAALADYAENHILVTIVATLSKRID